MKLPRQWAAYFNYCLISIFIITYFSISTLWLWLTAPAGLRPSNSFAAILSSYLSPLTSLTGLEQSWSFFSPNIAIENSYTLVAVTLQNGLLKLTELPRIEKLKLLEKLKYEKYRKLFNDNMAKPDYAFLRPDIARFISRSNNEPNNAPTRITFFLVSSPIPPPEHRIATATAQAPVVHAPVEKYFAYGVSSDDL